MDSTSQDKPRPRLAHQIFSYLLLIALTVSAIILVNHTPIAAGWRRAAIPLAFFGWALSLWLAAYVVLSLIRRKTRQDSLPANLHPYTVRLYSAWFIVCAVYGAWIIWGYPDNVGGLTAIVDHNRIPIADLQNRAQLTFIGTTYPFEHQTPSWDDTSDDLKTINRTVWSGVEFSISALGAIPKLLGFGAAGQKGLFPDLDNSFSIWLSKLDKQTVLTTVFPALMVFLFSWPSTLMQLFRSRHETRDMWLKEVADDTYFLGFLLTLAGLSSALLGIKPGTDNLLVALGKAGGAISTTFVAVVTRVLILDVVHLKPSAENNSDQCEAQGVFMSVKRLLDRPRPLAMPACPMFGSDCTTCLSPCAIGRTHGMVLDLQRCCTELQPRRMSSSEMDDDGFLAGKLAETTGLVLGKLAEIRGELLGEIVKGHIPLEERLTTLTRIVRDCCEDMNSQPGSHAAPPAWAEDLRRDVQTAAAAMARLSAEENVYCGLETRLIALESALTELSGRLGHLCDSGRAHATKSSTFLAPLNDKLENLVAMLDAEAEANRQHHSQHQTALDEAVTALRQEIRNAASHPGDSAVLANIAQRLAALEDRLDATPSGCDPALRRELRNLADRIDSLCHAASHSSKTKESTDSPNATTPQGAPPGNGFPPPSTDDMVTRVTKAVVSSYGAPYRHGW